jgi:lactoylglutathione lyase
VKVAFAIVFVSDMNRSVAFYRDVLGMTLRFQTPGWTEFETGGATLALHASEGAAALRPDATAAGQEAPGSCRPGLRVPDLDAFHARLLAAGVRCIQEPQALFGARIAQYLDPDGLAISVGEEPKARA